MRAVTTGRNSDPGEPAGQGQVLASDTWREQVGSEGAGCHLGLLKIDRALPASPVHWRSVSQWPSLWLRHLQGELQTSDKSQALWVAWVYNSGDISYGALQIAVTCQLMN